MDLIRHQTSINYASDNLININPDEIDRSLLCAICQEILKIPRECNNCHNNFCKKCIDMWLEQKNNYCPFRCPGKIKLSKSHRIIMDALRLLKFKCKNEVNGCNFLMNYENYIEHTQKCEFSLSKCPNSDCKIAVLSKDLNNHINFECEFQLHKCEVCAFESVGPKKIQHQCSKIAIKILNETRSEIDNFMIMINNKKYGIDKIIKEII
jgi:hypothetical protein